MAPQGPKNDLESAFRDSIIAKQPSASFSTFNANRLSGNTRILLPPDAVVDGNDKGVVLKLKKVTLAVIHRSKFAPLVISTQKRGTSIIGARLTPHGGEVAVELARKLSKSAGMRLLVLGTNIIALSVLDSALMSPRTEDLSLTGSNASTGARAFIEASVEKLQKVSDEFFARIEALLKV
jgi:hypothetical protein